MSRDLAEVVGQDIPLQRVSRRRGGEYHGPCPKCGGTDRFVVSPAVGGYGLAWCRQCRWHGDTIQYLRDIHSMSFRAAKAALGLDTSIPTSVQIRKHRAERVALAAVKVRYRAWQREKLDTLTPEYRELLDQRDMEVIAYAQAHRCPDLHSDDEADYWAGQLAEAYQRLPNLEYALDILTYPQNEEARFGWWREEVQGG